MAKLLVMHPLIETHRAELLALARRHPALRQRVLADAVPL